MPEGSTEGIESRLAAIVATSDDAIVSKDLQGVVRSWNRSAERIFGYTAAEMIGQPITRLMPPDRVQEEVEILAKIRAGQRVEHFQTIRVRKDGRPVDVSVTISPIVDSAGVVTGASKIARDITEMRRFQRERERLHELGKRMAEERDVHKLAQSITDVATELSGAQFGAFFYNVHDANGESYTVYTVSGVPREHFSKFPMPRNTAVFTPTFAGEGVVRSDDITQDPRYGNTLPHLGMPLGHLPVKSYLAAPVNGRQGRVIGGMFFGHADAGVFTEQAQSTISAIVSSASVAIENARLHQEASDTAAKFQSLVNSIPQLAWMTHPDGTPFWFNDRWLAYTGWNATTPARTNWGELLDPQDVPRVSEGWRRALAAGTPWEDTFALRRHDGVYRWYLSRALPQYDSAGQITYWFGTNTDVTEQRDLMAERENLLNAERAARAESERVGKLKDEFLATLSHELRTPLNAILGWAHLIQRGTGNANMLAEGIQVIERNARAQAQLIEDLLDMSRIISGKLRLDVQRVDVSKIIERAIDILKPMAEAKAITVRAILDPMAGPVSGDPGRLQQVLWNLLSNAIKFSRKNGKVEVLLQRVNSHIEITVADRGKGIEPTFLPHVFERFRQSDATTTRRYGGLGLGLAIVKQLVELHGGHVIVQSAGVDLGATFIVNLPLSVTRAEPEAGRQHPTARNEQRPVYADLSLEGVRVLVVDDERDSREMIARLLVERQANVMLAGDADGALELVKSFRPTIILSDIGMPGKDGYQFISEVRSLDPQEGGKTTAIALTAFARTEDRTRAMIAGYQLHMPKPIEPQELIATIASLTNHASPYGG